MDRLRSWAPARDSFVCEVASEGAGDAVGAQQPVGWRSPAESGQSGIGVRPVLSPAFWRWFGGGGELHLSGVHQLAGHLTEENHREVLRRAKHRSMREIDLLVAEIAPRADVVGRRLGTSLLSCRLC